MTTPPNPRQLLFKIPEVAEQLGMSPSTVKFMVQTGELRSVKRDGRTSPHLIHRDDIAQWIKDHTYNPAA